MPQTSSIAFGPMPAADAGGAGERVRGGDERIGAVVDVEHRPLGALEDHRAARRRASPTSAWRCRRCAARGGGRRSRYSSVIVCRSSAGSFSNGRSESRLGSIAATIFFLQDLLVEQVLDADPEPRRLVGVAGADARGGWCRSAGCRACASPGRVEQQVVGHDQVRVGRDAQAADVDAARAQRVELARSARAGRSRRRCRSRSACPGRGSPRGSGGASTPRRRARSCGRRCCRPGSARPRRRARRAGR